jgi:hypothetical protein
MRRVVAGIAVCALALACGSQSASVTPSQAPAPVGLFTVRGHVVDAATTGPLPSTNIYVLSGLDAGGTFGGHTETDNQGAYVLANRQAGSITIEALASGYNIADRTIILVSDITLDFALTKYVAPTYTLSGRVTDIATGMPLSGASLDVLGDKNGNRSTTTEPDGSYRFANLLIEGFVLRARYPGYDSEFRGVQRSSDSTLNIQMRPEMQSLSGTWTGTWTYSPGAAPSRTDQIPQMELTHDGAALSGGASTTQFGNGFDGTLRDRSAIGSTTQLTGTMRIYYVQMLGRGEPVQCVGTGAFAGTVNWMQMVIKAPQVVFSCTSPYTDVTLSLVRQH